MAYTSTRRSAKSSAKYVYCVGQTKGYVPLNTSRLSRLQLRQTGVFLQRAMLSAEDISVDEALEKNEIRAKVAGSCLTAAVYFIVNFIVYFTV